jgi:branched-chain amino acid transport system ATP-binding protein
MNATDTRTTAPALLKVEKLTKRFGGLTAVDGVDFDIRPSEILALIGPNGSGKTTSINVISGNLRTTSGQVLLDGRDLTGWAAHRRAAHGVARTFQNLQVFDDLTVRENVMAGCYLRGRSSLLGAFFRTPRSVREYRAAADESDGLLAFVDLTHEADTKAGGLSYGVKRRLEMARALATEPRLLLLDEPAAGLNPSEVVDLAALIRQIRDRGTAVLLVEHKMDFIMGIADRVCVLNDGKRIALDVPDVVVRDPAVVAAYLGSSMGSSDA